MKEILIVKLGSTLPELAQSHGDFEDWICSRLKPPRAAVTVIDARLDPRLPDPRHFAGIVLTGSHATVTDREPWSQRVAAWLPGAVDAQTPLLAICYGHQLLAYAMGGEVGSNPRGPEYGTVSIHLDERARHDPLFVGLPATILVQTSHAQSVLRLPPDAVGLAANVHDPHHAFLVGKCAWGVQFHPEFDLRTVLAYIGEHADRLRHSGVDPVRLSQMAAETPHGESILSRFAAIARRSG